MARPRHFPSVEAHDEHLIAAWNNRVRPDDRVFHLGDFAYGCSRAHARAVFDRLNGRKFLIRGNHDARSEDLPWAGPVVDVLKTTIQDSGMRRGVDVWLSHYAHVTWPDSHRGRIHCFGHSHGTIAPTTRSLDVGVDDWAYRPVSIGEVLERLAEVAALEGGAAAAAALSEAA